MIANAKFTVNEVVDAKDVEANSERINWSHQLLKVPTLWRKSAGQGVKVAVLDTGVDLDHPDLESAITDYEDFTGDGIEDLSGHGTHCAGIIGSRLNGFGFVGVAPLCNIIVGKVLGNNGSGSLEGIADGIDWAVEKGADIISMSLGGPGTNHRFFQSVHNALASGAVVVCAAGNSGSTFSNTIGYPGRYGGVITIASHDSNGNRSGFSSRGGEIDFMGPGSEIFSTYKEGRYATLSGTSMATPFVAGICALVMSAKPGHIKNCEDMRNELMKMAAHPGAFDPVSGYGPLNPFQYFYGQ